MKIKFNIPMINKFRNKFNVIKEKIVNNQSKSIRHNMKGYILLVLMACMALFTLTLNINSYKNSKQERYKEYITTNKNANTVKQEDNYKEEYKLGMSSICTEDPNTEGMTIPAYSKNEKYIMPVNGEIIKEYAIKKLVYSKTLEMWKTHPGIDIQADIGENIKSACDGTVKEIIKENFYGNTIKIQNEEGYIFVYSNLEDNIVIKENDSVNAGQKIGTVGVSAAGEIADESHLHFEILMNGKPINPLELILE